MAHRGLVLAVLRYRNPRSRDHRATFQTLSEDSTLAFEVERGRVRSSPVRSKRGDLKVRTLPATMIRLLVPFAPLFSRGVFRHAQVLLVGTILAPGRRTVS